MLGQGGGGTVFKGKLGTLDVAVKVRLRLCLAAWRRCRRPLLPPVPFRQGGLALAGSLPCS